MIPCSVDSTSRGAGAQDAARVVLQRAVVRLGRQGRRAELRVLDQRGVPTGRQHIAERQAPPRLRGAEVHQVDHLGVEDRPVGADEPAPEVLEQPGAGGRQPAGRTGVVHPAGAQVDRRPGGVRGRHPHGVVRQTGHGTDGGLDTPHPRTVLQVPFHQGLEVVRADHLVAGGRDVPPDSRAVPSVHPQRLPRRRRRPVEAAGPGLPEAPGAPRGPQRTRRRIDQDDGGRRTRPRVGRQPVHQGETRRPRADDHDVRVEHARLLPFRPPVRPGPVRSGGVFRPASSVRRAARWTARDGYPPGDAIPPGG